MGTGLPAQGWPLPPPATGRTCESAPPCRPWSNQHHACTPHAFALRAVQGKEVVEAQNEARRTAVLGLKDNLARVREEVRGIWRQRLGGQGERGDRASLAQRAPRRP